jgi:putative membrane protein
LQQGVSSVFLVEGDHHVSKLIRLAAAAVLFPLAATAAQTAAASTSGALLGPVDTYFVTQTSLGTPFQVDAGRVAEAGTTSQAIRDYADLMVSSHVTVNNALEAVLKTKSATPPPTLLKAAYATMVLTLQREHGSTLDADYVRGQVDYQYANTALYKYEIANGTDPDLKAFAQQTLPKIEDHLERVLKLQSAGTPIR